MAIDLDGIPNQVHRFSYVRIGRYLTGFTVQTYDLQPCGYLSQRERWRGQSEGTAMLIAQVLAARGYRIANLKRLASPADEFGLPEVMRGAR